MFFLDENKLNGKIAERGTTKEAIADEIGVDRSTFYRRIKKNRLLIKDAHAICEVLRLDKSEALEIFLAQQ